MVGVISIAQVIELAAEHLAEQSSVQEPRYVEPTATEHSQDLHDSLPATAGLLESVDNLTEEEVDALLRKLTPGAH